MKRVVQKLKLKEMELGCFYHHLKAAAEEKDIALAEAFSIARTHGITALDISAEELEEIQPEQLKKLTDQYDMHVASVHGFMVCGVETETEYAESLRNMKCAMKMAKCVGSKFFMPVPQKKVKEDNGVNVESKDIFVKGIRRLFSDLTSYGKELGLTVIVENFSLTEYPYTSYEDIDYLMAHNPDMRYAYDIGNYTLAGFDELEGVHRFIDKIEYVHLKDLKETEESPYTLFRNGKHYDSLELGGGNLRIQEALEFLAENNYQGPIIIEINSGPNFFDRAMQSACYLKDVFSKMINKKKVAVVGVGGISTAHIQAWEALEDVELTTLCSLKFEEMQEYPDKHQYIDFKEMLEKEDLDIVDLCVPTFLHVEYALMALEKGMHVLCEKPLTLNRDDVKRIYETAYANKVCFMVAHVLRFWKEYVLLKEIYDSKKYGCLLSGSMTRVCEGPRWSANNWQFNEKISGMVPFDTHIHDLDYIIYTFGKPEKITSFRSKHEKSDYVSVMYGFDSFSIITEAAWYDAPYPMKAEFRFQFEDALVTYESRRMKVYEKSGNVIELTAPQEGQKGFINLMDMEPYAEEIRYFAECVKKRHMPELVKPEELETVIDILHTM